MIRRTATGNAKNGMTWAQLRRQLWAIAGYLRPHGPTSNVLSAASPASASFAAIDGPQFAGDGLAVLPGGEIHRMAAQMHDAGLHYGAWKDGGDRLRKALQPVNDSDENVLDAAVLEFVDHTQPELGAFRGLDP